MVNNLTVLAFCRLNFYKIYRVLYTIPTHRGLSLYDNITLWPRCRKFSTVCFELHTYIGWKASITVRGLFLLFAVASFSCMTIFRFLENLIILMVFTFWSIFFRVSMSLGKNQLNHIISWISMWNRIVFDKPFLIEI